jgi:long-subunit acyl-CoA synthetase (AMP-forming)
MVSNLFANRGGLGKGSELVTHYSFMPVAHLFERMMTGGVLGTGGRQMIATGGSVANIVPDLATLGASCVASVPRIFIRYYDRFMASIASQTPFKKALFWSAYYAKRWCQGRRLPTGLIDRVGFSSFSDRVRVEPRGLRRRGRRPRQEDPRVLPGRLRVPHAKRVRVLGGGHGKHFHAR